MFDGRGLLGWNGALGLVRVGMGSLWVPFLIGIVEVGLVWLHLSLYIHPSICIEFFDFTEYKLPIRETSFSSLISHIARTRDGSISINYDLASKELFQTRL